MPSARKSASKQARALAEESQGQAHALTLIHAVCCLTGCPSLIDDLRNSPRTPTAALGPCPSLMELLRSWRATVLNEFPLMNGNRAW
jgi:hypothetical protein